MTLNNKNILITAGPAWVPIDKVRVISNIATGKTGIILAKKITSAGANVTLLLGPIGEVGLDKKINIKRYSFFDELHGLLKKELITKKYDIVIHSAAVSDYRPKKIFSAKLKSHLENLSLDLEPTFKIVDGIKKYAPGIFLVLFKLELNKTLNKMISKARQAMRDSRADLAVVNTFSRKIPYRALIIDKQRIFCRVNSKKELANGLLKVISSKLN